MIPIDPDLALHVVPDGTTFTKYGASQEAYITLPSLCTPSGKVLSQWLPGPEEIEMLRRGVPVTLVLHTFGEPLQPIQLVVGGIDLRDRSGG